MKRSGSTEVSSLGKLCALPCGPCFTLVLTCFSNFQAEPAPLVRAGSLLVAYW